VAETKTPTLAARKRPLSPHLQVYRLPLAALTSICHRASGVVMSGGAFLLVIWLWAAATSPECFALLQDLVKSLPGNIFMMGWVLATYYHLCAGIRHLFWDAGVGLEKKEVAMSNGVVIVAAFALTGATIIAMLPHFSF